MFKSEIKRHTKLELVYFFHQVTLSRHKDAQRILYESERTYLFFMN
jgi:hypothetical protein